MRHLNKCNYGVPESISIFSIKIRKSQSTRQSLMKLVYLQDISNNHHNLLRSRHILASPLGQGQVCVEVSTKRTYRRSGHGNQNPRVSWTAVSAERFSLKSPSSIPASIARNTAFLLDSFDLEGGKHISFALTSFTYEASMNEWNCCRLAPPAFCQSANCFAFTGVGGAEHIQAGSTKSHQLKRADVSSYDHQLILKNCRNECGMPISSGEYFTNGRSSPPQHCHGSCRVDSCC